MQRYSDDQESESYIRVSFPQKEMPSMEVLTTKLMVPMVDLLVI